MMKQGDGAVLLVVVVVVVSGVCAERDWGLWTCDSGAGSWRLPRDYPLFPPLVTWVDGHLLVFLDSPLTSADASADQPQ